MSVDPGRRGIVDELLGRLRACGVLVVVIGRHWLTLTDATGQRRIDDPADWVRREIAEALGLGLRVIPVLTDEVMLSTEPDLPDDIAGLCRRKYVPLRRRYTSVDLAYLVERITEADPELAKIAAQRQSATGAGAGAVAGRSVPFAGRVGELAALTGLLRGRADPGGTVVISGGTAGVGKTKPGS